MGLEDRDHPVPATRAGRRQAQARHLGRQVGVVVHEGDAAGLAPELEASGHTGETGQGAHGADSNGAPAASSGHGGHGGVAGIVDAGHRQIDPPQMAVRTAQVEPHGAARATHSGLIT